MRAVNFIGYNVRLKISRRVESFPFWRNRDNLAFFARRKFKKLSRVEKLVATGTWFSAYRTLPIYIPAPFEWINTNFVSPFQHEIVEKESYQKVLAYNSLISKENQIV